MAKQRSLDIAYMKCALSISELSVANRKKVGAIIVSSQGGIIAEGYNGTPSGFDNECENGIRHEYLIDKTAICNSCGEKRHMNSDNEFCKNITTKPEVLHAESNAIAKVARSANNSQGSTLYCTLAPCFECAKLIIQAGIVRVVYHEHYPYPGHTGPMRTVGLDLLEKARIRVDTLPVLSHNDSNDSTR